MSSHAAVRPRLWVDAPYTMKIVVMKATALTRDDPLGAYATIGFKTQCGRCMELIGVWDKRIHPPIMPSDDDIVIAGAAYLRGLGFVVDLDGVVCPRCLGINEVLPHHLHEGSPPDPTSGWIDW